MADGVSICLLWQPGGWGGEGAENGGLVCEVRRISVLPHWRLPCHSVRVPGHRICEGV